ncbi:MAG TPA: hypothetical protein VE130_08405, partial [Nitrososphaeraceae archaeon]|nr:hypothetical protein [Nitrososphaeraceae archaeon]
MVNLSTFLIMYIVMLSIFSFTYMLSITDLMAIKNATPKNISYTRHIVELPSEISWITGKFYDNDMNENTGYNFSDTKQTLLVTQTSDGSIHTLDMTSKDIPHFVQSITANSNISTFEVNASVDTGGPIIIDLNNDGNDEILSTTSNGSLAIIDYLDRVTMFHNNTNLSPLTQIVPYFDTLEEKSKLLGISENGTLLMINPNKSNNNNHNNNHNNSIRSNTFKFSFEVIETNFSNLLIDDRIVIANIDNNNPGNEVLILTDPVSTYPHGALSDTLEPTELLILGWCQKDNNNNIRALCLKEIFEPPEGMTVFETIKPVIMQYSNGTKPSKHIALVASNIDVGSAAYVYNDKSSIQFSSKPIGHGFRWLLILGSVKTNNNESMLVINETPHLSGIVKFIDITNKSKTMKTEGFSVHDYGSRNIGMYAIADLDNDEQDDLIIPTLNKKTLAIISIFNDDSTLYVDENLELLDRLSSNVIAMDINYDGYEDIIAGD